MTQIDYKLDIAQLATSSGLGELVIQDIFSTIGIVKGTTVKWQEELNGAGSLEFSLPIDHDLVTMDNFEPTNREVHLYRDNILIWGGKIWIADIDGWVVRFICYGWYWDLPNKRLITEDIAMYDNQMAIVRSLIDYTQAKETLGITHYDTATDGPNRQVVWCAEERKPIGTAIEDLSSAQNGFDFEITPDKKFRMYDGRKGTATNVTFTGVNMSEFRYQMDGTDRYTSVGIVGDQTECAVPWIYETDTPGPLLEGTADSSADIVDRAMREDVAEEFLRTSSVNRWQPTVSALEPLQEIVSDNVTFEEVTLGDIVTIEASRGAPGGFGEINDNFRVIGRQVEISPIGLDENISYTLDSVVN